MKNKLTNIKYRNAVIIVIIPIKYHDISISRHVRSMKMLTLCVPIINIYIYTLPIIICISMLSPYPIYPNILSIFSDGKIPKDSSNITVKRVYIDATVYSTLAFISIVGVIFSCILLIFNFYYRKMRFL